MKVIGLTGGIGMGKSTAAAAFRRAKMPVFDADAVVHRLQARGGRAVGAIGAAFPGTVVDGAVDRPRLRNAVIQHPAAMRTLERIVHPMVREEERRFLAAARRAHAPAAVLDIPLLLENMRGRRGEDRRVDLIVVVSAPAAVQRARVRPAQAHDGNADQRDRGSADAGSREAPQGGRGDRHRAIEASGEPPPAPPDRRFAQRGGPVSGQPLPASDVSKVYTGTVERTWDE